MTMTMTTTCGRNVGTAADCAERSRRCSPWSATRSLFLAGAAVLFLSFALPRLSAQKESSEYKYKNDAHVYDELGKAPKKAVNRRNPMEKYPDSVAAGAKLYDEHCVECHGELAEGGRKGPSLRAVQVQQATPGILFWVLTNGVVRRGMPVWSKLPEPQRWQIVTYLKSLAPTETAPR